MKYMNKELSDYSDEELLGHEQMLDSMLVNYNKKLADARSEKKFKGQPPPRINPTFSELHAEIKTEILKRKGRLNVNPS